MLNLKNALKLSSVLVLFALITFTSCTKKKDTPPAPKVVLDGVYVKGDAIAYSDFDEKAMMKPTPNEVNNTDRASLMNIYISVKKNGGFNIVTVKGSTKTTFGPGADFALVTNPTNDEPHTGDFYRGSAAKTSTKFTVPEDGFYHVIFDTELNKVVVARVHWGIIGTATPSGWGGSTPLNESAFNLTKMNWTATGMELHSGIWKLRYSNGWKIELDTTLDIGGGKKGVKVNTNLGGSISDLVPGGANIVNSDPGIYDIDLAYTLGTGYKLTMTKTGDIPAIDYSSYEMGMIGNAYYKANGDTAAWDVNFGTSLPVVNGTSYTWTYTTDLIGGGQFKFRQGSDWNGKILGFGEVTFAGPNAGDFSDAGDNIAVAADGNYTLVLNIEASSETYTVTATKN